MPTSRKTGRKMGRPTLYSEKLASTICERLADGESLNAMCKGNDMPSISAVINWLADERYPDFVVNYTRAREAQADTLFAEILAIADTPVVGERVKIGDDGKEEVTREDMLGHRRLQVDARKWAASKLAPKKYGDKLEVDAAIVAKFLPGKLDDAF